MNRKIIVTHTAQNEGGNICLFYGLFQDGELIEAFCEGTEEIQIGDIYIGRVQKVMKNIDAAFIEVQKNSPCYYPFKGNHNPIFINKTNSENMVQGDELLVQIQKEGVKTKVPTVSSNIELPGRYLVLIHGDNKLRVSSKIKSPDAKRLRALLADKVDGTYGLTVRTNAQAAPESEILDEFEKLKAQLTEIIQKAKTRVCFSSIYKSLPPYLSYIQNSRQGELDEILTDDASIFESISEFLESKKYEGIPLRLYQDRMLSLGKLYNIELQLLRAVQKKVWLRSGAYLVIEPTEAMTVIDVNSGKNISKKDPQKNFLKINLEAAEEICHQIRLRNVSGIIIVDFIDMVSEEDQAELLRYIRAEAKKDPIPVQVLGMTKLNLVEMTRKKIAKSLKEQLTL